jgi:hypothetical protein
MLGEVPLFHFGGFAHPAFDRRILLFHGESMKSQRKWLKWDIGHSE